jgi:hypothetical protein
MARQRFKPEQIIGKLREVEIVVAKGSTMGTGLTRVSPEQAQWSSWPLTAVTF